MQVIILAGGFGTRLQSVVKDVPKPLADIAGKPFLSYLLTHLKKHGATDIVLSVGYLQDKIIEYFSDSYLGMNISYAKENKPLGTGGAILNSLQYMDQEKPVVVVNGDTFLQINYEELLTFYKEQKSNLALVLRKMDDCSRYGRVIIGDDLVVNDFEEKNESTDSGLINGGIYVLNPKIFNDFELSDSFSFEVDFLMKELSSLSPKGFCVDEYFIDIGIPQDYQKSQLELPKLLNHGTNKALFLDRDGVINIDHGHVFEKEKFDFVDGIFDLCKEAQALGYLIIVVTNQAGIAKGFYSESQFLDLTKWVEEEFLKRDIKITKTFYCPYHVEAKIEKYKKDSFDRKPNPGMLLSAIEEFEIDPSQSIMIGDKETDIEAGKRSGIFKSYLFDKSFEVKTLKKYL